MSWVRPRTVPRWLGTGRSARLRLTVAFTLLVTLVGGAIVGSVYLAMSVVPDYQISSSSSSEVVGATQATGATPATGTGDALLRVTSPAEILRLLLTTSLIVLVVVVALGAVASWIIAGRVLRPIDAITEAAQEAAAGHLDHRIALGGPPDEFRRLADTFDDMLERLDRTVEAHRRFAANASHELRTPLATTQALLDVALLDPDGFDRETLTRKLRETNTRNVETVEALLALSDAQSGTMVAEQVDLESVVREVLATMSADASESGLAVTARVESGTTTGDPTLLRLLVVNLIGNAIRYNHHDGRVDVVFGNGVLEVGNTGPDISDDQLARLTEPFFRAAGRVAGSHGLGLALVKAIAEGHGATLTLAARPTGGLCATVRFAP